MKRTAVLALTAALAAGATSCSDDTDPPDARPTGALSSSAPPVIAAPTSAPPETSPTTTEAPTRVVPPWRVEYVDSPTADGSGEPVALRGEASLQVVLRGMGLPFDTGITSPYDSRTRLAGRGTSTVVEVAPGAVFEGDQLAFVGLRGAERPFRVFGLSDPPRVVVDVRDR